MLKARSNTNKAKCSRKSSGMEKVSAFEFMLLQNITRINFLIRDGDNFMVKSNSNYLSEWSFKPSSIVLFSCLQEQIRVLTGLKIQNLMTADIYKLKDEYIVVYSTSLNRVKITKNQVVVNFAELKASKLSPLIRSLFQERIIRNSEDEYRWIVSRRSVSAQIRNYEEIKDSLLNRVGILPYIIEDSIPKFFLGHKNINGSGLTDWGGSALVGESVEDCLSREFTEEFGSNFPFKKDLNRGLALVIREKFFSYCLIFLEVHDFFELENNFTKTREIKGTKVLPWNSICSNVYNGGLDGSLAFQIQEIKRYGGLIFSSTIG